MQIPDISQAKNQNFSRRIQIPVEDNLERDAPLLVPLPPLEAGPNSSDMVHTKIRRQQPKSRPEIKQERKPDNRIKL